MTALTTPAQIAAFRLSCFKQAVKAEARGMQLTRGRKQTPVIKAELGLKRSASAEQVLAAIEAKMAEILA
jgi:hypothetical protein